MVIKYKKMSTGLVNRWEVAGKRQPPLCADQNTGYILKYLRATAFPSTICTYKCYRRRCQSSYAE